MNNGNFKKKSFFLSVFFQIFLLIKLEIVIINLNTKNQNKNRKIDSLSFSLLDKKINLERIKNRQI